MDKHRVRWYSLLIDRPALRRLADRLAGAQYSEKRGHGFTLNEVRATCVTGRHIERTTREIVLVDQFGDEVRQTFTAHIHSQFRISTEAPGLELSNPTRSTKMLFSQLAALSDFSITIAAVSIDPLQWLASLDEAQYRSTTVRRLEFTEIAFRGGTVGTLKLEGDSDVRAAGLQILGQRHRRVGRVTAQIYATPVPLTVVLECDGKATLVGDDAADLRRSLRTALVTSLG